MKWPLAARGLADRVHGGIKPALARTCPKCEAAPGHPCQRRISGKSRGVEDGGGYTVPLKKPHPERKKAAS